MVITFSILIVSLLIRVHWSIFQPELVSVYRTGSPHQTESEIVLGRSISSIGLLCSTLHRPLAFIRLSYTACLKTVTAESSLPSLHTWEDLNRGVLRSMLRLAIVSYVVDVAGAVFVSSVGLAVRIVA